ncbi:MAG: peptide chain release factor N(5)-glutamine methyltransferase [Deltaproteobacteria bacterium]|nr:peptide chain release factor N(5)-glutamine methyltransferase [Deltaproteobacteria bacterium]
MTEAVAVVDDAWTVGRVLLWTAERFGRAGVDAPRLTAELLLARALGCERIALYTGFDRVPTGDERATMRGFVDRRLAHEPTAYILGEREFWSRPFEVTRDTLIPRPETETLVEAVLARLGNERARVIDVGTGSGAIAVTLAAERRAWRVVASDIERGALRVAMRNAARHGVGERVMFIESDLLTAFRHDALFDAVVSNAPYVIDVETAGLAPEVRDFEPRRALVGGGPDGLDVIRGLIAEVWRVLRPGGVLALEVGAGQAVGVSGILSRSGGFCDVEAVGDFAGIERVVIARACATPLRQQ